VGPFTICAHIYAQELGSLPEGSYFILLRDILPGCPPVYYKNSKGIHIFPLGILGGEPELMRFPDETLVMPLSSSLRTSA